MAVVDYFLKLDGIDGESQDAKHKGEIDVESWHWGETNAGSMHQGGGGGSGKVSMQDFSFTQQVNKASPKLALNCANGSHITKAVLTCRKAGKDQQEYLKMTFTDLLVTSYQIGGGGGVIPNESITLNFAKIEGEYKEQKPDGTLGGTTKFSWSAKDNTGG
jgi:type VI secretion system secreted protein Hcp